MIFKQNKLPHSAELQCCGTLRTQKKVWINKDSAKKWLQHICNKKKGENV